jgi:two-component system NtrC family sensor kinase
VDLNAVVEASLGVVGYGLRSAGVQIVRDLAPNLPSTLADGDQLQQVATNLVINAQQAMEGRDGERRLTILTRFDAAARQLRLEVADTGPGVAPAIRSRIFDPFFTTKSAGAGTGVGLSLCHGIVESHGGAIAVEDAAGGGARFVVRLPYIAPGATEVATAAGEASRSPPAAPAILIVDDEVAIARTLADMLAEAGYRIDVAAGGRAALDRIGERRYGLVLSDLRMPDLDGPALYRVLVERDPGWHERIVFLTGDTLSETALAFLDRTKRPCIEKPFNRGEVRRIVAEALAAAG